jgi:hypothetical protein
MNHMTQHAGQKVMPKPEETDDPNDNVFRMPPANHHSSTYVMILLHSL